MKKLWIIVVGCFLISLTGCHSKKEMIETESLPVLNQFIKIVHEVESYEVTQRDEFIKQSLSVHESSTENSLFDYLKDNNESIGFTETGPFLEDKSENPLNTLTIKYNLAPPSKSVSFMLAYRFSSKEITDYFQMALQTDKLEDDAELSTIFNLKSSLIGDVFEQLLSTFSRQTEIEMSDLKETLQAVEASFEEHTSEMKQVYSLQDGTDMLTISYDPQIKLIDLVTYDTQEFQKSIYFSNEQRILSITNNNLSQTVFENEIYEKLVNYLSKKFRSE